MNNNEYKPITVGDWILTLILLGIPLINLIMLLIWAFGGSAHPSKKSYAQATLILTLIVFVIVILFVIFAAILGASVATLAPQE
jgi:Mg2+/Co2+ transporter CorB